MITKKTALDNLYKKYSQCFSCPLGGLGRKNIVFGSGNIDCIIMLIGEGPGKQEDEQGIPFVGRSGQLLTKLLSIAGINRNALFIANIVKCRPPENRKPAYEEISVCTKLILFEQIKIIKPKIICTLGSTALEGLLNKKIKITQERGTIQKWNEYIVVPTFHPAYILRNPQETQKCIDDFILIEKISESFL